MDHNQILLDGVVNNPSILTYNCINAYKLLKTWWDQQRMKENGSWSADLLCIWRPLWLYYLRVAKYLVNKYYDVDNLPCDEYILMCGSFILNRSCVFQTDWVPCSNSGGWPPGWIFTAVSSSPHDIQPKYGGNGEEASSSSIRKWCGDCQVTYVWRSSLHRELGKPRCLYIRPNLFPTQIITNF